MAKFMRKDVERHMELKYWSSELVGKDVQLGELRGRLEHREWRPSWVDIMPDGCSNLWVRLDGQVSGIFGIFAGGSQCALRMRSILE